MKWMKINPMPLPEPSELPEYDEFVLWRTEEGNYFVDCIDKDDVDWWNGNKEHNPHGISRTCTHWARITEPEESQGEDQNVLWQDLFSILNRVKAFNTDEEFYEAYKNKFTLTRK